MKTFSLLLACFLCFNSFAESCLSEGISIFDSEFAAGFSENYPGCDTIIGDVIVGGGAEFIGMEQLEVIQGVIRCPGGTECPGAPNNFIGLDNVHTIGGLNFEDATFSFEGFGSLETITGSIYLDEINFTDFTFMNNLTHIGENLDINEFEGSFLNGLENLNYIGGYMNITESPQVNLEPLVSLEEIGNGLFISDCVFLETLSGLENLQQFSGDLNLWGNPILSDISALENLENYNITNLHFQFNESLGYCAISPICEYLSAEGTHTLVENLEGCNTDIEILASCVNSIQNINSAPFELLLASSGFIEVSNLNNLDLEIRNYAGQVILITNSSGKISLDHLPSGLYIVSHNGYSEKFIIKESN